MEISAAPPSAFSGPTESWSSVEPEVGIRLNRTPSCPAAARPHVPMKHLAEPRWAHDRHPLAAPRLSAPPPHSRRSGNPFPVTEELTMAEQVDEYFTAAVTDLPDSAQTRRARLDDPVEPGSTLSVRQAMDLFNAQLGSRHLDLAARWLRSRGKGFYTIGSSGHEGNVAVAAALRPTDPALLHYRSGGFFLARAQQVENSDGLRDVLLGIVAATKEPISGGRHKVRSARSAHHPADLDDRLPPSASGRGRLLHRPGRQARARAALARRQHRRLPFRRC